MPSSSVPREPYRNKTEFEADLARVLREDYGIALSEADLKVAALNVDALLRQLL